jgi:hypothetical protein
VRLSRAVVPDDEDALVVVRSIELELREHEVDQLLRHLLGDDVVRHQPLRLAGLVSIPQLNDRLDRLELDQVRVFHRALLCSHFAAAFFMWSPRDS